MPAPLEPIKAVKCTYKDCFASFDTEKTMKSHKKHSEEHDYCSKCDKDFDSYDDLAQHKAFRPDMHGKACRVCGDEFKCTSGLRRHIELCHRVDQKLPCVGCGDQFNRASLLIEHLEFGHCQSITAVEFQGQIVHKYLIAELLKGGNNYDRFMQKISKFDAAVDTEEEGGINLLDQADDEVQNVTYPALKAEVLESSAGLYQNLEPYPPLPAKVMTSGDGSELTSRLQKVSLGGQSPSAAASTTMDVQSSSPATRAVKAWGNGDAASTLFPNAPSTHAVSEWSVEGHDRLMEKEQGINIFNTRFWDPQSPDWNPERFYDSVLNKYYCPFVCEQNYDIPADLNRHILNDHRITKMHCPYCLKHYKSCTALVAHCESRGSKCQINKADDFGTFLDRLTGGFLGVEEKVRPEFINNPAVMVTNPETGRLERYRPPIATYLQYEVTKPPGWTASEETARYTIGGGQKQPAGLLN